MDPSFSSRLISSHLLASVIFDRSNESVSLIKWIEKVYGLDAPREKGVAFRERCFYLQCWSPILDAAVGEHTSDRVSVFAYQVLQAFAPKLSQISDDYKFYCHKLLSGLHSGIVSGNVVKSSAVKCLQTYLKYGDLSIVGDLFNEINDFCFLLVSKQGGMNPYENKLGAIALWRTVLTRGVGCISYYPKYSNLTLVLSQIKIMAISSDSVIRKQAEGLLSDLVGLYKCMDYESICDYDCKVESLELLDLEAIEDFEDGENNEIEYFLRGSIAKDPSDSQWKEDFEVARLKQKLQETTVLWCDQFSNHEVYNIEKAIVEGLRLSLGSNMSIMECIFSRFLEITYEDLAAAVQDNIDIDLVQKQSIQQGIDTYKNDLLRQADDIEAKFINYVVPFLKKIIDVE